MTASASPTQRTPSPGAGPPIWALRRRSTFSDAAPAASLAPVPCPAEAEPNPAQAVKPPDDDKPETKKDIFRRSALKIVHTAGVHLPRRGRHVRSKSAVPAGLPPPSTPGRARAQSLQSEQPVQRITEGWVKVEKTRGGREGGLGAPGNGGIVKLGAVNEGETGERNNNAPQSGKLRRRRNLNVTFDCPEPPKQWERDPLPQSPWPTPTTPYLVADGPKLRTVFPEPPRVHHT